MPAEQRKYWILTIPSECFLPYLPPGLSCIRGQLERGDGGFLHWQLCVAFCKKVTLTGVRRVFGPYHAEPTRSAAARDYVWKEDTRVEGTQFELGSFDIRRNSPTDWDRIRDLAKSGSLDAIPPDVYVRCFHQLRSIGSAHIQPTAMVRRCSVFWGRTETGKSRRAWAEAGDDAYSKCPRTKWWDGYGNHRHVIIDEFRGTIDISHLLRWLDRYPVRVEVKGGSVPLSAEHFWITSNLNPRLWYPELDSETLEALLRRLNITHFL
jgi:hypothetical protein